MNKQQLEKRKAEMTARARSEIAKSEIVQFRLDPENILLLYESAEKNKKPVGTMVRDWVLERMRTESGQISLADLPNRVQLLEKKIEQLTRTHKRQIGNR